MEENDEKETKTRETANGDTERKGKDSDEKEIELGSSNKWYEKDKMSNVS